MKPHFHKVPVNGADSFSVRRTVRPHFGTVWHYHPELELHYVVQGEGVRFIGDDVSNFNVGELILLGENLPHTWRCSPAYFEENSGKQVESIVVHFRPDCLGSGFLHLHEAAPILRLYDRARRGLVIESERKTRVVGLMEQTVRATPLHRLALLLAILHELAEATPDEVSTIASAHAFYQPSEPETDRLNAVCNYTLAHYASNLSLAEVAAVANLSVTSFCRYFKLMTHKTYFDFLTEVRISHACRALAENRLPTEVICSESGFNNLSNFYRHFKRIKGTSPVEFRRSYHAVA